MESQLPAFQSEQVTTCLGGTQVNKFEQVRGAEPDGGPQVNKFEHVRSGHMGRYLFMDRQNDRQTGLKALSSRNLAVGKNIWIEI